MELNVRYASVNNTWESMRLSLDFAESTYVHRSFTYRYTTKSSWHSDEPLSKSS